MVASHSLSEHRSEVAVDLMLTLFSVDTRGRSPNKRTPENHHSHTPEYNLNPGVGERLKWTPFFDGSTTVSTKSTKVRVLNVLENSADYEQY